MYIAQYEEYTRSLLDHLVDYKLKHWDRWVGGASLIGMDSGIVLLLPPSSLRELAAAALHNLTVRDPSYMREESA